MLLLPVGLLADKGGKATDLDWLVASSLEDLVRGEAILGRVD